MQSVIPEHSPMHHTLTPHVPLILPVSVISAKQTHTKVNAAFRSYRKDWHLFQIVFKFGHNRVHIIEVLG